jgi:hypothetical protein
LPDRIFSYQNKKIGTVLKALEDNFWYLSWPCGTLWGHLLHFMAIWYILRSLANLYPFWYVVSKNLATLDARRKKLMKSSP